ncbi:MAG: cytochrome c nitrite reductase small subunit [Phycisphaeraceae bacterium]|nr:cytochrome c nitrite reductase small subunit [Phycisphaeraceae bacterium]
MLRRPQGVIAALWNLRFISARWRTPCLAALGMLVGSGLFVAHISRAASYLNDDPETCVNCHVMFPQYSTWQHGSHANVANCNDCHVPHDNFLNHYSFKARDGMWHSTVFTMRWEPQVIRLSKGAIPVVEDNCRRCHTQVIENVALTAHQSSDQRCWDCHRDVPHGTVRSLSATPTVMRPALPALGQFDSQIRIDGRPARSDDKEPSHVP